jgi:hypothetical protein
LSIWSLQAAVAHGTGNGRNLLNIHQPHANFSRCRFIPKTPSSADLQRLP